MTLQVFQGMLFPEPAAMAGAQSSNNFLIDAASEAVAFIFQAPKTGSIDAIGFCTGTVTTGATVDVRLETVSTTTGDPTGTLVGTTTNGAQVILGTDDNIYFLTVLTLAASVTKGDILAAVIVNPAVSVGNLNIISYGDGVGSNFPYCDHFTAAWAKTASAPLVTIRYNDGSYAHMPNSYGMSTTVTLSSNAVQFNSSSTPDEIGMIFQFPFACAVDGCWVWLDLDNAADIVLYDSDGTTALATVSADPDIRSTAAAGVFYFEFTSAITLTKDTNYRIVVKPTTTSNVTLQYFEVGTAAAMDAHPGGQELHYTTRADAGSWTETTTRRPFMGLKISSLDDGAGSGGTTIFNIHE